MAFLATKRYDDPRYKVVLVYLPESDAIKTTNTFQWSDLGCCNFIGKPEVYWTQEEPTGVACDGSAEISIPNMTATSFTVVKTSATTGLAVTHIHVLYAMVKRAYEI